MKRTKDDLLEALKKQRKFLESSCATFDNGDEDEALRIAVVLRSLVHDTTKSQSLLKQLELKNQIKFIDSSLPIDPVHTYLGGGRWAATAYVPPGLIGVSISSRVAKFRAPLSLRDGAKGFVLFSEWWTATCIPGHDKKRYSRKELVLTMANKEGGAHIDADIDMAYKEFASSNLNMAHVVNEIETGFMNSAANASMRQIAWEMLPTLDQGLASF